MAIKIEHGGQAGPAAGQIIGQGLQNQADIQQRDRQLLAKILADITSRGGKGRGAGGGGGSRGRGGGGGGANDAMNRLAFKAEADKQAKEQKFSRDMALKQEDARLDSAQWEYEYTTKQKQEMSQLERGDQLVEQSDDFSPEEKAAYRQMSVQRKAGFNPTLKPIDPNKPQFEEGRPANSTYIAESGTEYQVQPDGSHKMVVRPDQAKEYLAGVAAAKLKQVEIERAQKVEDDTRKMEFEAKEAHRKYLQEYELKVEDEPDPKEPGVTQWTERLLTPLEIEKFMMSRFPPDPGQQQQQQQIPTIETREQRDLLPPNTEYIGPDGIKRRTGGLLPQQPIPLGRR